jgi:hypothetical protein
MIMGGVPNAVCTKLTINREIAILKADQRISRRRVPAFTVQLKKGPGSNLNTACVDSRSRRLRTDARPEVIE